MNLGSQKHKAKRIRTTFDEDQLVILQKHFVSDSNPDGADLERIAQLTGNAILRPHLLFHHIQIHIFLFYY